MASACDDRAAASLLRPPPPTRLRAPVMRPALARASSFGHRVCGTYRRCVPRLLDCRRVSPLVPVLRADRYRRGKPVLVQGDPDPLGWWFAAVRSVWIWDPDLLVPRSSQLDGPDPRSTSYNRAWVCCGDPWSPRLVFVAARPPPSLMCRKMPPSLMCRKMCSCWWARHAATLSHPGPSPISRPPHDTSSPRCGRS